MTKEILVICKNCHDIPVNRECYCKLVATEQRGAIIRVFADDLDSWELCIGFLNNKGDVKEITNLPNTALGNIELNKKDTEYLINYIKGDDGRQNI